MSRKKKDKKKKRSDKYYFEEVDMITLQKVFDHLKTLVYQKDFLQYLQVSQPPNSQVSSQAHYP